MPNDGESCSNVGVTLSQHYEQAGDVAFLKEEIKLKREERALQAPGHPSRAVSCNNLGSLLHAHYEKCGEIAMLDEMIDLQREALALRPLGHPDRAFSCSNLGSSLHTHYRQCGDLTLLNEAVELKREALALLPPGHPNRAVSCNSLATSLHTRYRQCGDLTLLDKAIELKREALALRPPGHVDRAFSSNSLAISLLVRYEQCCDLTLLDEVIELEREALSLRPPGHSDRELSCHNLGSALRTRHEQCGDVTLLDEAIELKREALALQPPGHPSRAIGCGNLGSLLHARYEECGDLAMLNEMIDLQREALALRPPGHPDRAFSCNSLGTSLRTRYQQCGDRTLLDQIIKLEHEALALRPPGHPYRPHSCRNLSYSLLYYYGRTQDVALLHVVIVLCGYALECGTSFETFRSFSILSQLRLIPDTPFFSVTGALNWLDLSFRSEVDDIHDLIRSTSHSLSRLWSLPSTVWTPESRLLLCVVYAKIIDKLPLAVGFVLNTPSRLQILKSIHHIGIDALVAAVLTNQPSTAVELLDRAHGLVWTQALHQRDPQMEGAPPELASELAALLREIAVPVTAQLDDPSYASRQDSRHRQNTRIQALLREIRTKPGLERFMLGRTYNTLREAARDHPVIVLAAGRGHAFALIMPSSTDASPSVLHLEVAWLDQVNSLASTATKANPRYRAGSADQRADTSSQDTPLVELTDEERAMRPGNFGSDCSPLARLWLDVVKPVLTHLHLTVRRRQAAATHR
jgi:tetratricopeptide (TPR) repeat protein